MRDRTPSRLYLTRFLTALTQQSREHSADIEQKCTSYFATTLSQTPLEYKEMSFGYTVVLDQLIAKPIIFQLYSDNIRQRK